MPSGDVENRLGLRFESAALLVYILSRLREGTLLYADVYEGQDATFTYSLPGDRHIVELVQVKKVAEGNSRESSYGDEESWTPGTFHTGDLAHCFSRPCEGGSVATVLETDPEVLFTLIVFGQLANPVAALEVPAGNPGDLFSPAHVHEPDALAGKHGGARGRRRYRDEHPDRGLPPEELLRRTRVVRLEAPFHLRLHTEGILALEFAVAHSRAKEVRRDLEEHLDRAMETHLPHKRRLDLAYVRRRIAAGGIGPGRWRRMRPEPSDNLVVERLEFLDAWRGLSTEGIAIIHGDPGSGKTTCLSWLALQYLARQPEGEAYYLQIRPEADYEREIEFFERHVETPCLFLVDDEQSQPEAAQKLADAHLRARQAGRDRACLAVASITVYSQGKALSGPGSRRELNFAHSTSLQHADRKDLGTLLSRHGPDLALGVDTLEVLSDGKFGLAALLCRVAAGRRVPGPSFPSRLVSAEARTLFRQWLLRECGREEDDDGYFYDQLLPPLVVGQHVSLRIPPGFTEGTRALREAGFLEASESGSLSVRNVRLSMLLGQQYRQREEGIFGAFQAYDPPSLVPLLSALQQIDRHNQVLRSVLAERSEDLIGRIRSGNLGHRQVSVILVSVAKASRSHAPELIERLCAPSNRPDGAFLWSLLVHGFDNLPSLSDLIRTALRLHRSFLRRLARGLEDPGPIRERVEEVLLGWLNEPKANLDEIGRFLATLRALSPRLAERLWEHFVERGIYEEKIRAARAQEGPAWTFLRFCEGIQALGPAVLEEELASLLDGRSDEELLKGGLHRFLGFLARLGTLDRRRALVRLADTVDSQGERVSRLLGATTDLETHCTNLERLLRVNRRVSYRIARELRSHTIALASGSDRFETLGKALDLHLKNPGIGDAAGILSPARFGSWLHQIKTEGTRFTLVGRFLTSVARADVEAGEWFAARLSHRDFLGRIHDLRFLNWCHLIRGLLLSAGSRGFTERLAELQADSRLRDEIRHGMDDTRNVSELAAGLSLLLQAGVGKTELLWLAGLNSVAGLKADVLRRLRHETEPLHRAHGLWILARLDLRSATEVLEELADPWLAPADAGPAREGGSPTGLAIPTDLGFYLQILSAVDPPSGALAVSRLGMDRLLRALRGERSLGRIVAVLDGLASASFSFAQRVATAMTAPEAVERHLRGSERPRHLLHYGRALAGISREAARAYVAAVHRRFLAELPALLRAEADLKVTAGWAKLTRMGDEELREAVLPVLREAAEDNLQYDTRFRALLEAGRGFLGLGAAPEAQRFFEAGRGQLRHGLRFHSLQDWIDLWVKVGGVLKTGAGEGLAEDLGRQLPDWRLQLLVFKEPNPVIAALGFSLAQSAGLLGSGAAEVRATILDRLRGEGSPLLRVVAWSAVDASPSELEGHLEGLERLTSWERGLALVAASSFGGQAREILLERLKAADVEPRSAAASELANAELALHLRWADAAGREVGRDLERLALERADDELRLPILWFLRNRGRIVDFHANPHLLWGLLKETVLRASYLPWEDQLVEWANHGPFRLSFTHDPLRLEVA